MALLEKEVRFSIEALADAIATVAEPILVYKNLAKAKMQNGFSLLVNI